MNQKCTKTIVFFTVATCLSIAQSTHAASVAVSFTLPQSIGGFNLADGLDGFDFIPNVDLTVTALGWYDHDGDGLTHSHPVGIYVTGTQTLVAPSANILGSSALDTFTNFRYVPVSPFTLLAGTTYTLIGYGAGPVFDQYVVNPAGGITLGSGFDYAGLRTSRATGLEFPSSAPANTNSLVQELFLGPNFQYTAVPEPQIPVLFTAGLFATLVIRRRSSSRVEATQED
jgi:hypothetical protein